MEMCLAYYLSSSAQEGLWASSLIFQFLLGLGLAAWIVDWLGTCLAAAKASTVCRRQSLAAEWDIAGLRMSGVNTVGLQWRRCVFPPPLQ